MEAGRGLGKLSLNSKLKHHCSEECFAKLLIREWSIALTFSVKYMLIYGSSYTTFNYTLCVELISMCMGGLCLDILCVTVSLLFDCQPRLVDIFCGAYHHLVQTVEVCFLAISK